MNGSGGGAAQQPKLIFEALTEQKGVALDCGYRLDLIVEDRVILELKSIDRVLPIHDSRLLTYLKLLDKPVGLILNFNVPVLRRGGIIRKVFDSASPRLRGERAFAAGLEGVDVRE